ncbi:hypothetical protein [Halomicrobium katesii]|uniref:hypothetical protein n=1 Tax=Halomicrobium katesii TaxID=437163 RepID=UPI0003816243|nr:hypothetical protein [Halomicrobium katesii]
MSTKSTDTAVRYPTQGPSPSAYDRYTYVTAGDHVIIYDDKYEDAWVQARVSLDLDEWR